MIEHKITLDELAIQLGTNLTTGLTTEQAIELNRRYGDNILSEKKKIHPFWRYLKVLFLNPFNAMLWVGAILCIIAYAL
jgi:magnesium-transporting ATPase (P-type)